MPASRKNAFGNVYSWSELSILGGFMNTSAINSGAMFVHYNPDKLKDAVFEVANLVGTFLHLSFV